jgi:GDPmannose 4,6-dehydratase
MRRVFISGISGQDGSYLAEQLLAKGAEVHGLIRPASTFTDERLKNIYVDPHVPNAKFFTYYGDMATGGQLSDLLNEIKPDEIYNLASQSHVRRSFDMPEYTSDITGLGTLRLLEAIRKSKIKSRMYQASSSECFGNAPAPQNEETPFNPRSPYACAKTFAHQMCAIYREGYGMFISCGILFNHESPRRLPTMVTRKTTLAIANILAKKQDKLYLGNLEAKRDWGFAPEYCECMIRMLEQDKPDDFVVGTGETHSVRELLDAAFGYVNLDWHDYVEIDPTYFRPTEVDILCADARKAKKVLDWEAKVKFKELVRIMVDADIKLINEGGKQ